MKNFYSVWALPPEDLKPRLKKLMHELRSEFNGPELKPHVTVVRAVSLTERDARDKFKSACEGLRPYMPHLSLLYADLMDEEKKIAQERANALDENVGSLSFQITRLALYRTDTEDKTLNSWEKIAECDLHTNYMPHLSLLYADLTDEEKKIAQERANAVDENIGSLSF
ncbi:hypothetical protein RJ639_024474 [Escallonia herrerae]|uniref:Cyclic phosphodiesterase n=1 Tax=Escallonia herrerae TaxID=1293975 RepID=A0AA89ADW3_9ASTE|nr:hypothetical protein RJ639_024474 [Escallonia herrerae]